MSITQKIRYGMLAFGIIMGIVFPFYARLFTDYKEGMQIFFDLGCLIAGVVIGLVSFALVKHFVLNELEKMSLTMKKIAQGDLKQTIELKSNDSIGALADDINYVASSFKNIIKEIRAQSAITTEAITTLFKETNQIVELSRQSLDDFKNVNEFADNTTSYSKEVTGNIQTLGGNFDTISNKADSISSLNLSITKQCREEYSLSQSAADKSQKSINHIEKLAGSLADINTMMLMVKDIAGRTSLLALNANIEAASAGAAGQGFGVVANEVKALANQTQETTKKIQTTIESLNQNSAKTITAIQTVSEINTSLQQSSHNINEEIINQAEAIGEIVANIENTNNSCNNMSLNINAIDEQLSQVTNNINILSKSLQASSATIKKVVANAHTVLMQSKNLSRNTDKFNI